MCAVKKYIYSQHVQIWDMHIIVHRHSHTTPGWLSVTHTTRLAHRYWCVQVSPESNNVTVFSITIQFGRPSPEEPLSLSPIVFFLFLSLSLPPSLCVSVSLVPLWHFEAAPVILPYLHVPRVQLALQTPYSQHIMHNPASVMLSILWCFQVH